MKGITVNNPDDDHKSTLQVSIQPNIGLNREARDAVVDILNHTLADEVVLAIKSRCAHWNVCGAGFIEHQILFASQYEQLNAISDEIAERIRMLGGIVIGSLAEFISYTRVEEHTGVTPDTLHLLADHEASIRLLREDARKCTEEYEDAGTCELMVSIMRLHEKVAWMLRSYLELELTPNEKRIGSFHVPVEL